MRFRTLVTVVIPVLCVAGLAACRAGGDSPSGATSLMLEESSLIAGAYANPLDPIMFPNPTQQSLITAALEQQVSICMQDRGFDYNPGDGIPRRRGAEDAQYTFTVTDPDVAAEYGFHPASWVRDEQDAEARGKSTSPEGYEAALLGETDKKKVTDKAGTVIASYDPDSCLGKAKDAVTPKWAQQERIYDVSAEILLDVSDEVPGHEKVQAASRTWGSCMEKAGYSYASPMDAADDFDTNLPTSDEIKVAVASATCQQESGLLRTWSEVRARLTQVALDKHPGIVAEWLGLQREAASRAEAG